MFFAVGFCVCFFTFKLVDKITDNTSKSMQVAKKRTIHVLLLVAAIYFNPIVALVISLVKYPRITWLIMLLILGSTFFVTEKVIIPLSNKMHKKIIDDVYGKDSDYAKFVNEYYEKKEDNEKILKIESGDSK